MSRPRKTPSQQRSRFTYDMILEAAARVFDREGMAATTNRVAERAGVSVGSLYQYFPNKRALLHELALRHIEQAEAAFAEAFRQARISRPSPETVVADLVRLAVRENGPLVRLHHVLREHTPRTPEIERRFERFLDVVVDGLLATVDPPGDAPAEARLRILLAVAALDSQIHQIVLAATTAEERDARTDLLIEQTLRVIDAGSGPSR